MTQVAGASNGASSEPSTSGVALSRATIAVTVMLVAAVCLPRLVPVPQTDDHGTFVSVAERLLAGDRLYVEVWDNKDPVFYWALALGRAVSPLADVALEVAWVALACAAAWSLGRSSGLGRSAALLTSGLVPLVLTGSAYVPGMTHLPGIALSLAAIAAAVRRRWLVAGAIVGLVVLTKVTMAPVAGIGVLVCLWRHRSVARLARVLVGGAASLLAGVAVLAVRGELTGWLVSYRDNFAYSTGELSLSRYGGAAGHLLRAFPEATPRTALFTLVSLAFVLVALPPRRVGARRTSSPTEGPADAPVAASSTVLLWQVTLATSVVGLAVLALTATWPYHGGSLGVPAVVALVLVAVLVRTHPTSADPRRARGVPSSLTVGLLAVAAFCLGGALHPAFLVQSARGVPSSIAELRSEPQSSVEILAQPKVTTYARAGSNDLAASAVGLGGLELLCPRFHQYSFQPSEVLEDVAACLPRADALIVADTLVPDPTRPPWDTFVRQVRRLVSTGYTCRPTPGAQVCIKSALYVAPATSSTG